MEKFYVLIQAYQHLKIHRETWCCKINNSSTTKSELCRNAGPSAFQLQESMLKSDKIWCRYLVTNCVSLRTFWTPLVVAIFQPYLVRCFSFLCVLYGKEMHVTAIMDTSLTTRTDDEITTTRRTRESTAGETSSSSVFEASANVRSYALLIGQLLKIFWIFLELRNCIVSTFTHISERVIELRVYQSGLSKFRW